MNQIRPTVSVVICAYTLERWTDLLASVNSIHQQEMPSCEIVVVIDNNPALFEKARFALTNVKVVENTGSKGLSAARNTGVAQANGRLIAFLDDDAIAESNWLIKLCNWCENPGVLGAGGRANPAWAGPRPRWFPDEFGWVVGFSYKGLPERASKVRNFFGSGMCFDRKVFEMIGGFRSEIGRINKLPLGCEETEFCIRAVQRMPGGIFIYEPDAIIQHKVPPSRATWAYFLARCYSEGISKAIVTRMVGSRDGLSSERSYVLRVLPAGVLSGLRDAFLLGDWFGFARATAILLGLIFTIVGYLAGSFETGIASIKGSLWQVDRKGRTL